jgi:hypothetical protein
MDELNEIMSLRYYRGEGMVSENELFNFCADDLGVSAD